MPDAKPIDNELFPFINTRLGHNRVGLGLINIAQNFVAKLKSDLSHLTYKK